MRVSVEPNDPGYLTYQDLMRQGKKPEIELNGRRVVGAVTADEEAGEVKVFCVGDNGLLVPTADRSDYQMETVKGSVRIIVDP